MMNLFQYIVHRLEATACMPFVDFMQHALYTPALGYYSTASQKFGREGDFITAPTLTPLFGYTLANQCAPILQQIEDPILFEFGAGTGQLCVDLLTHLERLGCLPKAYHILEVSGVLQHQQQQHIQQHLPHLLTRVTWLTQWPKAPFSGVVIANEVLDAMPVHRFLQTSDGLLESHVACQDGTTLQEIFKPCTNQRLIDHVQHVLAPTLHPYLSEANLFINDWIAHCSAMIDTGALFLLDYGFPRHEYYHPDRTMGTLVCHHKHRVHTDPLLHLGEQDITAHVEFTHVAEAAVEAGFHVAGYTNQASFLLANGLLHLLESEPKAHSQLKTQQAVKQLLQPSDMGELFKVLALTKHIDEPLQGFQWHDKRASL